MQSGSDAVLRRMARRCKTEEFAKIVRELRSKIPHFNITTDIIVGFPGESEQEWQDSFNFIKQMGFGHIHIFTYSSRAGTRAAELPNQITHEIKKQRSQQLHELAHKMKLAFCLENKDQEFSVLWEGYKELQEDGTQRVFGYTPNYLRVAAITANDHCVENKITTTRLLAVEENYIFGKMITNA